MSRRWFDLGICQFDIPSFAKLKLKLPASAPVAGEVLTRFKLGEHQYAVYESSPFECGHMVNLLPSAKSKSYVLGTSVCSGGICLLRVRFSHSF
jgi:hypothetical protein